MAGATPNPTPGRAALPSPDARREAASRKVDISRTLRWLPTWAGVPLLALLYYALALFGISIAYVDPVASPIWPASGVALGFLLLGGRRFLPAIFVGETLALFTINHGSLSALGPAALAGLGNMGEGALALWGVQRWLGKEDILRRPVDVYPYALATCLVAAPLGASAGLAALAWNGHLELAHAARIWGTWWIGDCASMMVITPVFAAWARPWTPEDPNRRSVRFWLACATILGMFAIVFYANTQPPGDQVLSSALGYFSVGAFIWSIILLGRRGTSTSYLFLGAASILGIYHGRIQTIDTSPSFALITSATGLAIFHLAVLPIGILVEDRKRNRRTLETQVEERTRDLAAAMQDLKAAKEAAEVAAQAKSNFLATMSHEIRTPLNAVIGTAELMATTEASDAERANIETIRTSSEHLLSVINDILDYSKAEAGKLQLQAVPLDLAQVVREAVALGGPHDSKPVTLRIETSGPSVLLGDPHRIRQVLLNYLSNAVKFTPQGEIVLGAATTARDDGLLDVHLWVKDPGPGIEPARQKELFQPFSQIAPVMTRAKGGTGLGLAIVKRILDALGGSVGLDSAPGAGSTFHARFTAAPAKLADAAPVAPPSRAARLRPLRILLAEDNAVNRQVAGRMLQHLGQAPATAVDGSEAVAKVEAGAFDLVLMDIHMPGMDGLEATRRIRQAGSKVRIVALTADALVEDRAKCLAAGMDDYISKPVRLDELERVLRTAAAA